MYADLAADDGTRACLAQQLMAYVLTRALTSTDDLCVVNAIGDVERHPDRVLLRDHEHDRPEPAVSHADRRGPMSWKIQSPSPLHRRRGDLPLPMLESVLLEEGAGRQVRATRCASCRCTCRTARTTCRGTRSGTRRTCRPGPCRRRASRRGRCSRRSRARSANFSDPHASLRAARAIRRRARCPTAADTSRPSRRVLSQQVFTDVNSSAVHRPRELVRSDDRQRRQASPTSS